MSETGKASASRGVHVQVMRSQLGRVRGLGSAKSGVAHWWAERVTSIALVPLTLWFIVSLFGLIGASQDEVAGWMAGPVPIVLMLCLIAVTFHHMQLGLQVVIDDYVHADRTRFVLLLALRFASVVLALAAAVSVLKLGL